MILDAVQMMSAVKPVKDIKYIIKLLKMQSKKHILTPGMTLEYSVHNEKMCYCIISGTAIIYRKKDNLALSTLRGPTIIGISSSMYPLSEDRMYLRAKTPLEVYVLPLAVANEIFKRENAWQSVCIILNFYIAHFFSIMNDITQPSAYQIVRLLLLRLEKEPPEIRNFITACQYIQDHSSLSRSGVMLILTELKKGKFIDMNRGILVSIGKLPLKF